MSGAYTHFTYATGFIVLEHEGETYEIPDDLPADAPEITALPQALRTAIAEARSLGHKRADALRRSMRQVLSEQA